jgi:hypothetical protein
MQVVAEFQIAPLSVFLFCFNIVRWVSNIALGKQLSSACSLTLGEDASVEYLFSEWATPSIFGPSPSALALHAFRLSAVVGYFSTYQSK